MSSIDNFNYAQALKDSFAPLQTVSRIPLDQTLAMRDVINERGNIQMQQSAEAARQHAAIAQQGEETRKTAAQEAATRAAEAEAASNRATRMREATERLNQRLDVEKRADAYRVPVTDKDGKPRSQTDINADIDKAATSNVKNYQSRLNDVLQQQENLYKNNTDLAAVRSKALADIQSDPSLLQSLSPEAAAKLKGASSQTYPDIIRSMRTGMHPFDRDPLYAGKIDDALQARVGALAASSQDANLRNAADKAKTLNLLAQPLAAELAKHMGNLSPAGVSEFTAGQADDAVKGLANPEDVWKQLGGSNSGPPSTGILGPPAPPKPPPAPAYPASPLTQQLGQAVQTKRAQEEVEHNARMTEAFTVTLGQQQRRRDEVAAMLKDSMSDPDTAYAYAKQLDKLDANIAHNKALIQKYAAPAPTPEAPAQSPPSIPAALPAPAAPSPAPAAPPALPTGATNAPMDANHPAVQAFAQKNGIDLTPPSSAIVQAMRQFAAQDGHSDADIDSALQAARQGDINAIKLIAQYKARATAAVNGGAMAASVQPSLAPGSQAVPTFLPYNPNNLSSFFPPPDQTWGQTPPDQITPAGTPSIGPAPVR